MSRKGVPLSVASFGYPGYERPVPISLLSVRGKDITSRSRAILVRPFHVAAKRLSMVTGTSAPRRAFPLRRNICVVKQGSGTSATAVNVIATSGSVDQRRVQVRMGGSTGKNCGRCLSSGGDGGRALCGDGCLRGKRVIMLGGGSRVVVNHAILQFGRWG